MYDLNSDEVSLSIDSFIKRQTGWKTEEFYCVFVCVSHTYTHTHNKIFVFHPVCLLIKVCVYVCIYIYIYIYICVCVCVCVILTLVHLLVIKNYCIHTIKPTNALMLKL